MNPRIRCTRPPHDAGASRAWLVAGVLALASSACGGGGGHAHGSGGSGGETATASSGPGSGGAAGSTTAHSTGAGGATTGSGGASCGDGTCAPNEDATSCCEDCGVCHDDGTVTMHTGVSGGMPGGAVTPGGMVDTHASFTADGQSELVFPMMVTHEPIDGTGYFWAQQFFFDATTDGGYTGMQTGGIANGMAVGKMFIFSIWNAVSSVPGPGATCEVFGGEGEGQSCRLPFKWRENVTYRFAVRLAAPHQWSLSVNDPALPGERLIGTIVVPDTWGQLRPPTAGFTEYFAGVAACASIPEATAVMFSPRADGVAPTSVTTSVYGTCAANADSSCAGSLCN